MLKMTKDGDAILLDVKIVPGSSRTRYLDEWDGRARIAVAAAPEKGRANSTLIAFIAKALSIRRGDVTIVRGFTSPLKTIRIARVSADAVCAALQPSRS